MSPQKRKSTANRRSAKKNVNDASDDTQDSSSQQKSSSSENSLNSSWAPPPVSDTWEDLDVDLDQSRVDMAEKLVKEQFKIVQKNYRENEQAAAKKQFFEYVQQYKQKPKEYKVWGNVKPAPLDLFDITDSKEKPFKITKKVRKGKLVVAEHTNVPVIRFKSSSMLPRMRYFVHTERNITSEESLRLSHIPYIDDMVDDRDFVKELREAYTEGIHGADRGCDQYINDFMMHKLLTATQRLWGVNDLQNLYAAIFKMFPNKYSLAQLRNSNLALSLKERFEGPSTPPPNQLSLTEKVDDQVSTCQMLLCEREPISYDCKIHTYDCAKTSKEDAESLTLPVGTPLEPNGEFIPCNENSCYAVQKTDLNTFQEVPYTLKMIFNVLISENGWKCCDVAENMNKSCGHLNFPPLTCSQWFAVYTERRDYFSSRPKSKKITERDLYKKFKTMKNKVDNSLSLEPCKHEGPCSKAENCSCREFGRLCTRYCRCPHQCFNRLPGCTCTPGQCSKNSCSCYLAGWECDPYRCKTCNSDIHDKSKHGSLCRNIAIQQGLRKQVAPIISNVAGVGCSILEEAKKGDLISEYTGEIISNTEAERRGRIYDKLNLSYVFNLNSCQAIDAALWGNTIRFANHARSGPNCFAKVMVVDGEQRIGVYAAQDLNAGDELFFDYGYTDDHETKYVGIRNGNGKKSKR